MAQFTGFTCDTCKKVITDDMRTRKRVRFEGPEINGDYTEDLCPDCVNVPEHATLRAIRRRKRRTSETATPAQSVAT